MDIDEGFEMPRTPPAEDGRRERRRVRRNRRLVTGAAAAAIAVTRARSTFANGASAREMLKEAAARRFGMKTVILPALNEPDIIDIPEELRRDMRFVFAKTLEDVLAVALGPKAVVPVPVAAHGPQDLDA